MENASLKKVTDLNFVESGFEEKLKWYNTIEISKAKHVIESIINVTKELVNAFCGTNKLDFIESNWLLLSYCGLSQEDNLRRVLLSQMVTQAFYLEGIVNQISIIEEKKNFKTSSAKEREQMNLLLGTEDYIGAYLREFLFLKQSI